DWRTKRIQDLKVQRTQSSNKGEIVDSGTLRNSRLAKNRTLSDIADWKRIQDLKVQRTQSSNKGHRIEAVADWPRIEAVAEFRVALYHIAEWPRIEAVAEFRLWPRIEAVAEFRLRTGQIASKHLHRLGVYTQPT
ncbi:unnamed protein product, partial [Rodentolepis nana]|uniref:IS4 family transposase n=1 Tax=Rodentolepis nana TaxID=102285 RepID=A0A0R3TGF6_RODNA